MKLLGVEATGAEVRALAEAIRARRDAVTAAQLEMALITGEDFEDDGATSVAIRDVFRQGTPPGLAGFRDRFLGEPKG